MSFDNKGYRMYGLKIELYAKEILGLSNLNGTIFHADCVESCTFAEAMIVLLNVKKNYSFENRSDDFICKIQRYYNQSLHNFCHDELLMVLDEFETILLAE